MVGGEKQGRLQPRQDLQGEVEQQAVLVLLRQAVQQLPPRTMLDELVKPHRRCLKREIGTQSG